jgi:hypothetical protein
MPGGNGIRSLAPRTFGPCCTLLYLQQGKSVHEAGNHWHNRGRTGVTAGGTITTDHAAAQRSSAASWSCHAATAARHAGWIVVLPQATQGPNLCAEVLAQFGVRLVAWGVCRKEIVAHAVTLLVAALRANQNLDIPFKGQWPGWLNLFEP